MILEKHNKLFVYGSLRKDLHNNHYLEDSSFTPNVTLLEPAFLYDLGSFPALQFHDEGRHIVGELYIISSDKVGENVSRLERGYNCREVKLSSGDLAMVFYMDKSFNLGNPIEFSDWKEYQRSISREK